MAPVSENFFRVARQFSCHTVRCRLVFTAQASLVPGWFVWGPRNRTGTCQAPERLLPAIRMRIIPQTGNKGVQPMLKWLLRRQLAVLGIILQRFLLLIGGKIFVLAQPLAGMALRRRVRRLRYLMVGR